MVTVTNCVLCSAKDEHVVWQNTLCRVVLVQGDEAAAHPGFCRVILNAHAAEMTDMAATEQQALMSVVFAVEASLRECLRPDKINLASLGNVVAHVHWHVIPRWKTDRTFPSPIWCAPVVPERTPHLPAPPDIALLSQTISRYLMMSETP